MMALLALLNTSFTSEDLSTGILTSLARSVRSPMSPRCTDPSQALHGLVDMTDELRLVNIARLLRNQGCA